MKENLENCPCCGSTKYREVCGSEKCYDCGCCWHQAARKTIMGDASTGNTEAFGGNVASQASISKNVSTSSANIDYPSCSGNPASCPENEGYGCCNNSAFNQPTL